MLTIPQYDSILNNLSQYFFDLHQLTGNITSESLVAFVSSNISCDAYAKYLRRLNDAFLASAFRKKFYIVKDIRSRTIVTTLGSVSFKRRYYQHKKTKQFYFYIDSEILVLKPFQRLSNDLISSILSDVTSFSYQAIASKFALSKTTIYNIICGFHGTIFTCDYPDKPKDVDILYIQADECYASLQKPKTGNKNNKLIIEEVVIHEGLIPVSKGRNKLVNKTMFSRGYNETSNDFYNRINDAINSLYNYNTIYFYGDGANWITGCTDTIGAIQILDLFHAYQAISRITSANKEHIDTLINLCLANSIQGFIAFVENELDAKDFNDFKTKNYNYIKNNWRKIQRNYNLEKSVGCSQEGINFHYFAKRLMTTPKGFSEKNVRTIAQLICAKNNDKNFKQ